MSSNSTRQKEATRGIGSGTSIGSQKPVRFGLVMAVYLAGIFMGAIDTGIVTPARTIIQNDLMVDAKAGIWMITIYTLAYAASIPIMGKLADRLGRKSIYLTSIFLFGLGSLFCGLAQGFGSFELLLCARVVQAIGGGGILPVATAEFGTTFPQEKRGMALGLVGGVYGLANIFGSSAGSAIMDLVGTDHWAFIFYVNLPITAFILIAGFLALPNTKSEYVKKIDIVGILLLTCMTLSLLYGLKNIDFFAFSDTITKTGVYPFLLIFLVLLPVFILVEKKAEDPVLNLSYFTNRNIVITLLISFAVGIIMMGMVFVPQFSENAVKMASGSGGYFVIILGLFAGIGAPLSGKLIDKFGPKLILGFGFLISLAGSLFLILVAIRQPSMLTVIVSLILIGTGMGFTLGTPLNYMMLEQTKKEESNSALATLSLIRSIGTTIAPAIMIGFIAHAGLFVQADVMAVLPNQLSLPQLPYTQELSESLTVLQSNPLMAEKLKGVTIPDLAAMSTVSIAMGSNSTIQMSDDLVKLMQNSDVTTITANSQIMAAAMFDQMAPAIIAKIQTGLQSGIDAMQAGLDAMNASSGSGMPAAATTAGNSASGAAAAGMTAAQGQAMAAARQSMTDTLAQMVTLRDAIPPAFAAAKADYLAQIRASSDSVETAFQDGLNKGFQQVYLTVGIASLIALAVLAFYRRKKSEQ